MFGNIGRPGVSRVETLSGRKKMSDYAAGGGSRASTSDAPRGALLCTSVVGEARGATLTHLADWSRSGYASKGLHELYAWGRQKALCSRH